MEDQCSKCTIIWKKDSSFSWPNCVQIRAVVAACLSNLIIGSFFHYPTISNYISQHFVWKNDSDITTTIESYTLLVLPIWLIFQSISLRQSIPIANKIGIRSTLFICFTVFALINYLSIYLNNSHIFVFGYGIISGIFIGIASLLPLYLVWNFCQKKAKIIGSIVMSFIGVSPIILMAINSYVVSKNDKLNVNGTDWFNQLITQIPYIGEPLDQMQKNFILQAIYVETITILICIIVPGNISIRDEVKKQLNIEDISEGGLIDCNNIMTEYIESYQKKGNSVDDFYSSSKDFPNIITEADNKDKKSTGLMDKSEIVRTRKNTSKKQQSTKSVSCRILKQSAQKQKDNNQFFCGFEEVSEYQSNQLKENEELKNIFYVDKTENIKNLLIIDKRNLKNEQNRRTHTRNSFFII